jgi:energy-coupling factor transport system permease protein
VLERGMERAISLSESMDSRGFGHQPATRNEVAAGWLGFGGLLALAAGFLALVARVGPLSTGFILSGTVLIAAAAWIATRGHDRTRYRHRRMAAGDWGMVALAAIAPVAIAIISLVGNDSLLWAPSPITWPSFDPVVAIALLPLLAPLLRLPSTAPAHDGEIDLREPELVA